MAEPPPLRLRLYLPPIKNLAHPIDMRDKVRIVDPMTNGDIDFPGKEEIIELIFDAHKGRIVELGGI